MSSAERSTSEDSSRWLELPLAGAGGAAVPFVVMVAALRGLTVTLPIFHSTDEATTSTRRSGQFARQLPFPDLGHYVAAQTPLFPLLEAYLGKLIGYALWEMRFVEVVISYLLALAVYVLLERRLGLRRLAALCPERALRGCRRMSSALRFGRSPDNLATLFIVLAIERFERFREKQAGGPFSRSAAARWPRPR